MTAVMVQGCTSWAGKSWLTTALCRWYARQGLSVAPFKAQNMANNARVVPRVLPAAYADLGDHGGHDGLGATGWGEIGTAQWLQAKAAGVAPDTRMNPVLVKPESHTSSQVVVNGVVDPEVSRLPWNERAPLLRRAMHASLHDLRERHDLVVIEGAGSPAEVNLDDQVNMAIAHEADASVLLVADIDRGGAFAHLYGTWGLLAEADRERLAGFVLNRFRGDASLLSPGPERLAELTGVPTVGVVPMVAHGLPDEDGAALHPGADDAPRAGQLKVGVVRYPTASNLDEYARVEQVAAMRWVTAPSELAGLDLLVLPGSKHVLGDARWLRATGLADAIVRFADRGGRILGICGGLQLLGRELRDPKGVDGGDAGDVEPGLGLLDVTTTYADVKVTRDVEVRLGFNLGEGWAPWSGLRLPGYEIRHGDVVLGASAHDVATGTVAVVRGNVLGVLAHGILEDELALLRLFGAAPTTDLDAEFDRLADVVDEHLDTDLLHRLAEGRAGAADIAPLTGNVA